MTTFLPCALDNPRIRDASPKTRMDKGVDMHAVSCLVLRIVPALICLHVLLVAPSAVATALFERESINSGHYERLLPYAVALDVEKAWSVHFSAELARAGLTHADLWNDGMPGWYYTQGSGSFGGDSFASDLSCGLASAVFASSSLPGSDGGGSTDSGGGGGGGGGGGW
jgi:hypothetical protein